MNSLAKSEIEFEILIPVYNEADSIEHLLHEIAGQVLSRHRAALVVCDDGCDDGTPAILSRLAPWIPFWHLGSPQRKGYSRALKEGLLMTKSPWVLCMDSDGQCDPGDLERLWAVREPGALVIGHRVTRRDSRLRLVCSRFFYRIFKLFFRVKIHDPSCPMVLMPREVLNAIVPSMGLMNEGFWWEFVARAHQKNYRILEVPIRHRPRFAGKSKIYHYPDLPKIFFKHCLALWSLRFSVRT